MRKVWTMISTLQPFKPYKRYQWYGCADYDYGYYYEKEWWLFGIVITTRYEKIKNKGAK